MAAWVSHCVGRQTVRSLHCRSWCAPAGFDSHSLDWHVVWLAHTRFELRDGAATSYSESWRQTLIAWHLRSWCVPAACASNSVLLQIVTLLHCRSEVAVGACVSQDCASHVCRGLHLRSRYVPASCASNSFTEHVVCSSQRRSAEPDARCDSHCVDVQTVWSVHSRSVVARRCRSLPSSPPPCVATCPSAHRRGAAEHARPPG